MKLLLRLKDFRFQRYESGISKRCYCVHNIIVRLVLIQQRRDSDKAQSNSRADWPELRDYRLKIEIFQLGATVAPLKTRRCKRVAHIASPQTRNPEKYCVYRSHTRLYVDFSSHRFWCERTLSQG